MLLRVGYEAPAECPNAATFLAQVFARTALAKQAGSSGPATALVVSIRSVPGGYAGRLELQPPDAAMAAREVTAADCAQVVTALALMTALAIDPNAATAPIPAPAPAVPSEPATPTPSPRSPDVTKARWRWTIGAALDLLAGFASQPSLLVRPFVELERERNVPLGYAFRISGARAHAAVTSPEGGAELTLWAARAEACPMYFVNRALRLAACLAFDAGQLHASGSGISPVERVDRPWVALGQVARLEIQLFGALALELAGDISFPFVRDRFFIHSDTTIYRAPVIVGGGAVGLGVRFP